MAFAGEALASRSVGGQSDQIVLWPLGGVAYVNPPPRPGATLWSIAAGPLVNVVLLPVLFALWYLDHLQGWRTASQDLHAFIRAVLIIDVSLLVFNLLPIYPLDGGQILRSLLWYPLGKARSLMAATLIGFVGGVALIGVAMWETSLWLGILAVFLLSNCWRSFQVARVLRRMEQLPRRPEFACPVCQASPPIGNYWRCRQCGQAFDMFATAAVCPHCGASHETVTCPDCGNAKSLHAWDVTLRDV